jgi:uncharacterized membrane protein
VVGLIFPPSIIASAIVAGGAGAIWGKIRDKGFKDEDLKQIGESLPPGSSAIIAIAEDRMVEQLESALAGYDRIARHAVSAEAAALIVAEVEDGSENATAGSEETAAPSEGTTASSKATAAGSEETTPGS